MVTGNTIGRIHVAPPTFVPPIGGIFSVAPLLTPEEHALMGITFETDADGVGLNVSLDPAHCIATAAKTFDTADWETGEPFHIYAGRKCTMFDNDFQKFAKEAELRLERGDQRLIETKLWTGIFPARSTVLGPVGGTDVTTALGILEQYAGVHYSGRPIVHVGKDLAPFMARHGLITDADGDRLATKTGSELVVGAGYDSQDGGSVTHHAALASPVVTLGAKSSAASAFAAGTYFWKVTAINSVGETLGSNEVTATLAAADQQILNWTAIAGATGYKVYRGTAAGAENKLVATLGAVATYTDTGTAGTTATLPVANTTAYDSLTTAPDGKVWMYITGQLALRGGGTFVQQANDPNTNLLIALAERTIVPAVDSLVAAILVTLG